MSESIKEILDKMGKRQEGRKRFADHFMRTDLNKDEENTYEEQDEGEEIV